MKIMNVSTVLSPWTYSFPKKQQTRIGLITSFVLSYLKPVNTVGNIRNFSFIKFPVLYLLHALGITSLIGLSYFVLRLNMRHKPPKAEVFSLSKARIAWKLKCKVNAGKLGEVEQKDLEELGWNIKDRISNSNIQKFIDFCEKHIQYGINTMDRSNERESLEENKVSNEFLFTRASTAWKLKQLVLKKKMLNICEEDLKTLGWDIKKRIYRATKKQFMDFCDYYIEKELEIVKRLEK